MGVSRKRATSFRWHSAQTWSPAIGGAAVASRGSAMASQRAGLIAASLLPHSCLIAASSLLGPWFGCLFLRVQFQDRGALAVPLLLAFEPVVDCRQRDVSFHEIGRLFGELLQLGASLLDLAGHQVQSGQLVAHAGIAGPDSQRP